MSTINGYYASPIKTRLSENEIVPKGWRWVELQDVARLESGHTPSRKVPEYWEDGNVPWLSLKDIRGMTSRYVDDTTDKPTKLGIDNSSARILPKGTVAFCRTASVGNVAILGQDMATSQDFVDWVCGPNLLPEFLFEAFKASGPTFANEMQGSTHKTIYMPTVKRFKLLLPPLSEQKRIADILDKADAIRRKRQEAALYSSQLSRSAFLKTFGDPATNSKGWPQKPLGEILTFMTSGSRGWAKYYSDSGDIFIRIQNIGQNKLFLDDLAYVNAPDSAESRRTKVAPNDILMSVTADLGRTAVAPENLGQAFINQHLVLLRLSSDYEPLYVSEFLASKGGQQQIQRLNRSAVKAGLNFNDVKSLVIPIPPKSEQVNYSHYWKRLQEFNKKQSETKGVNDDLFNSLVQRAFKGKL